MSSRGSDETRRSWRERRSPSFVDYSIDVPTRWRRSELSVVSWWGWMRERSMVRRWRVTERREICQSQKMKKVSWVESVEKRQLSQVSRSARRSLTRRNFVVIVRVAVTMTRMRESVILERRSSSFSRWVPLSLPPRFAVSSVMIRRMRTANLVDDLFEFPSKRVILLQSFLDLFQHIPSLLRLLRLVLASFRLILIAWY